MGLTIISNFIGWLMHTTLYVHSRTAIILREGQLKQKLP